MAVLSRIVFSQVWQEHWETQAHLHSYSTFAYLPDVYILTFVAPRFQRWELGC